MKKYLIVLGLFLGISFTIHFCYNLIHSDVEHSAVSDAALSPQLVSVGNDMRLSENKMGQKKEKKAKAADHKHEYNDYFFSTRSYPDEVFDFEAYRSSIISINDQIHSSSFKSTQTWDDDWRVEGPNNIGGRINALAIHPNTEDIIYAGSAWGGIFKTTDAGQNWEAIFDEQPFLSIATIEIDPSDADRIYVGTGDVNISGHPAVGNGLYRSDDAGMTWTHLGLEETGIISKVKIDPNNADILYVGTMGFPFERDNNRGLYKSIDGGATWTQSLFLSDEAGIIDLIMDPNDGNTLYACGWNRIRNNTESTTWGDDGKIWKTIDGGANWTILDNGLPQTPVSRIGIAMSPMDETKLYAVYTDTTHFIKGVYKSEDAGASWISLNITDLDYNTALGGFGWYFGKIFVDPGNDDQVYVLGVDLWKTNDGGWNWELATPELWNYTVHADKHAMVHGPNGSFFLGTDGGIYKSDDYTNTWTDIENLPNTQIYRVEASPHADQNGSYGIGCQDNGTTAGNYTDPQNWPRLRGGDGFQVRYHPTDDQIMYSEVQYGEIAVSTDGGTNWDDFTNGIDGNDRRSWDMQYLISPHNPDVLYTGTYRMYKTDNGTNPNWEVISESLSDSVTLANRYHIITSLDESPITQGKLYAGTVDANVWISSDDGANWTDISAGLPERYVTSVKTSPTDADAVYVTHSGYKDGDNISHVHFSSDNGANWVDISGDLPDIAVNDIIIAKDQNDALLFIATDAGVYVSENAGVNWERIGTNMPVFQIYDLDIDYNNKRLAAATFARSLWTYDISDILLDEDTQAPVIVVNGEDSVYVDSDGNYDLPDVTAFDETDGDITDSIAIDESQVDIDAPGTYPVIYTVSDEAGNETSYIVYVVVLPVGISEPDAYSFNIYPNPAAIRLHIKYEGKNSLPESYTIISSDGKHLSSDLFSDEIDVSRLPIGTFIIRLEFEDGQELYRSFVKK